MLHSPYRSLGFMVAASYIAMYILMYAMVNVPANVYANVNEFYMAGLMTAPMALIELMVMRHMYKDRRKNIAVAALGVVVASGCWLGIRRQAGVTDQQFLRSMIPHHASALLMCGQAPIHDAEIQDLCRNIIRSQQAEIDQMKTIFRRVATAGRSPESPAR
jgi:uncharacterized protein (DUF305 family)